MTKDLKEYLYSIFSKLAPDEAKEIMSFLQAKSLQPDDSFEKMVPEIRKKRYSSGYYCPYCSSKMVVRYGTYRQEQRYLCKSCNKTFTDLTATSLNYIPDKDKFLAAAGLMLSGASLSQTAGKAGVSVRTAFDWRHKVLTSLKQIEDECLQGIVEADDTFFLHSLKGERNIGRKPRKRGGTSKKRGISSDQVCVLVARDRKEHTITEVATRGHPSADQIDKIIGKKLSGDCLFLTDKHPSFRSFAKRKAIGYRSLDLSKGKRVIKGIYHIQNVNSYHSRLKAWMARFKGVAIKYLSNYLHWFEFIDTLAKDKLPAAAEKMLLFRACSVKGV